MNSTSLKAKKSLDVIQHTDVFRTYDAAPLLVTTTTLQRVDDILRQTAGNPEYRAFLNVQDDCNVAAALGLTVAVKRHPMKTPRHYKGIDYHAQIAGDRHVDKRLNEMDRFAMWQRIAPPMNAGYGTYRYSTHYLVDSIVFRNHHTWYAATFDQMVRQSAPSIMTRNIALPEVKANGMVPYVLASKFPNGTVAIATEGRVHPSHSWMTPRADIILKEAPMSKHIGVFGYFKTLTLEFENKLPVNPTVLGQDLLSKEALDISDKVIVNGRVITIPGDLIDKVGTMKNDKEDISCPGMVLWVE
ncbi:hypothetical protein K5X82_02685 [Halosquirtibacter xylanolyticus]|uniref:hypothetical protein n=1 Tax=Halosquirtibacter xylanolyticus TaxID=3374599 RepID=UPI003749A896|nr:hypothetical protein K5X82_02685 [Prolixibacteraceae bacterium]